jgi:hypothetical protein
MCYYEMSLHSLFYLPMLLAILLHSMKYEMSCYALHVYVWEWMDSLGVSGDTLSRSW